LYVAFAAILLLSSCGGGKKLIQPMLGGTGSGEPAPQGGGGVLPLIPGEGIASFPSSFYEGPYRLRGIPRVSKQQADWILEEDAGKTPSDINQYGRYATTLGLVYGSTQTPPDYSVIRPIGVCPSTPTPPAEELKVMVVFVEMEGSPATEGPQDMMLGSISDYVKDRFGQGGPT